MKKLIILFLIIVLSFSFASAVEILEEVEGFELISSREEDSDDFVPEYHFYYLHKSTDTEYSAQIIHYNKKIFNSEYLDGIIGVSIKESRGTLNYNDNIIFIDKRNSYVFWRSGPFYIHINSKRNDLTIEEIRRGEEESGEFPEKLIEEYLEVYPSDCTEEHCSIHNIPEKVKTVSKESIQETKAQLDEINRKLEEKNRIKREIIENTTIELDEVNQKLKEKSEQKKAELEKNKVIVEIDKGFFYNIKSYIYRFFQKIVSAPNEKNTTSNNTASVEVVLNETEIRKNAYLDNLRKYEEKSKKSSEYYSKRNQRREMSLGKESTEPKFNRYPCSKNKTKKSIYDPCSCGDGICASYEDKCHCPEDCGSCPENTFCRIGECIQIIEGECHNTICEEGENETCPWDCYVEEEKEEIFDEETAELMKQRKRLKRKLWVESQGGTYVEGEENEPEKETLPEPTEE